MTNPKVRDNQLSFAGLVAICVSAMIGSAIFDLPKNMATVAGATAQILAWITTGIGMWLIAEVFMILSAVKPDLTAGMYDYGVKGFGPFVGFLTAWGYFVSNCATNAAFAVLVMNTLNYFFPWYVCGRQQLAVNDRGLAFDLGNDGADLKRHQVFQPHAENRDDAADDCDYRLNRILNGQLQLGEIHD